VDAAVYTEVPVFAACPALWPWRQQGVCSTALVGENIKSNDYENHS
jgi:hypothetical protein